MPAAHDPTYAERALKFFEPFIWIAAALGPVGDHVDVVWDEEDGLLSDLLRVPGGRASA